MQDRPFISLHPLHSCAQQVGEGLVQHETWQGFFAAPHVHEELQVTLPLAGRMHLEVGSARYLVGPEQVIVLPAGVPHAVTFLDGGLEYVVVTAPKAWLGVSVDRAWVVSEPFLWPLARQMASEMHGRRSERFLRPALDQMAELLERQICRSDLPVTQQDPRLVRAVDRLLRDHQEALSIERLAAEIQMSPRHFERQFRSALGVSPRRYLIDVRLSVAKGLLQQTDKTVTEIAVEVGFAHASHFIGAFRRKYGMTPARFREGRE